MNKTKLRSKKIRKRYLNDVLIYTYIKSYLSELGIIIS